MDAQDHYTWDAQKARGYRVARYSFSEPLLVIPIDGRNREELGVAVGPFAGYAPFQKVALELHQRFGRTVHGTSWQSFHRNQPGRVYALWHHHKSTVSLKLTTSSFPTLGDDPEWQALLTASPGIEATE